MTTLFFSYSHHDEPLRDQLETHLSMLKRQGFIETWHDRRIAAGESLDATISANLEAADIVLLLISPDFLNSDYCYEQEMLRAIERDQAGDCTVIPIILRPCDWHAAPFGGLLAAPKDGKPVTQWTNLDAAFLDITTAIKSALKKHSGQPRTKAMHQPASGRSLLVNAAAYPRSSNLRIAKKFSEHDKDQFLLDSFEFIAKFFENSLNELTKRNPGIDGRFRRIDANRFTTVAYRDGSALCKSSVVLGSNSGLMAGISYSNNDSASTTSFNENLKVESDDQAIFLISLGMSSFGHGTNEKSKLTPEGGAELYWDLFIEPLQRDHRR